MHHRHPARDALMRFQPNHRLQQIQTKLIQVLSVLGQRDPLPLGESGLEIRELQSLGPVVLAGCALDGEDLEYLVDL